MSVYVPAIREHYRNHLPGRLAHLTDPEEHYRLASAQITAAVDQRATDLAGDDPAHETYWAKVTRLASARAQAEQETLQDMLYLLPDLES